MYFKPEPREFKLSVLLYEVYYDALRKRLGLWNPWNDTAILPKTSEV